MIAPDTGIVRIRSCHSVSVTSERLTGLLKARGILIFAHVHFSYDAARAGVPIRPEELLIFGSPKLSAPLMQAAPTIGLELPVKALIWQDSRRRTWIAYNDPQYLLQRHGVSAALSDNLSALIPYIEQAARP